MEYKIKTVDQIINAMNALGGHCYYKDLYAKISEMYPNCAKEPSIRATIERNSSDSKAYQGKNDLFYSIDGLGSGHWGLRNPDLSENTVDITTDDEGFIEGKKILRKHILKERNHALKIAAIKNFKNIHNNKVYCEICGFDFFNKYGDIGRDFIEAHHTKPVSEMKENERTKIEDIVLLCSNCHSMIHRKRPWLKKEDIKKLIK